MNLQEILIEMNACDEAIEFASGKTLEQAWKECPRGQLSTADICRQYLPMPELAQIIIEEPLKTAP